MSMFKRVCKRQWSLLEASLLLLLLHFPCFLSLHLHHHHGNNKRQYINDAVQIDRWSGPFFNEDDQTNAFKQLVNGDVTGTKRMELEGIDPSRILNPLPIKEKKKLIKDEGPVAETYIGSNPYPDKVFEASPQERLANLISEPIIHDEPLQSSEKKHKEGTRRHYNDEPMFTPKDEFSNLLNEKHNYKIPESEYIDKPSDLKSNFAEKKPLDMNYAFESKGGYKMSERYKHEREDEREKNHVLSNYMEQNPDIKMQQKYESSEESNRYPPSRSDHKIENFFDRPRSKDLEINNEKDQLQQKEMFFGHDPDYKSYMFHEKHHGNSYDDENELHHSNYELHHSDVYNADNDVTKHIPDKPIVEQDNTFNNLETHRDPPGFTSEMKSYTDEPTEKMISQFEEKDQKDFADSMKFDNQHDDDVDDRERDTEQRDTEQRDTEQRDTRHDSDHETEHETENKRSNIAQSKKKLSHHRNIISKNVATSKRKYVAKGAMPSIIREKIPPSDINKIKSPADDVSQEYSKSPKGNKTPGPLSRVPINDDAKVTNSFLNGESIFSSELKNDKNNHEEQKLDDETIYLHHSKLKSRKNSHEKNKKLEKRTHHKNKMGHALRKRSPKRKWVYRKGYKRNDIKKPINNSSTDDKTKSKRWGPPHSHSTEHQTGFLEDNLGEGYHHPHIMTIGQHEGNDIRKDWNNLHSAGNGFYNAMGVGPARIGDTEYSGHHSSHFPSADDIVDASSLTNPLGQVGGHVEGVGTAPGHGLFGDDAVHSLTASESHADRDTAGIIDAIWEHDYENHGSHAHRHKEGMLGFFGHSDQNALLPAETLDGIAEHWEHVGHHQNSGMYTGGEPLSQPTAAHSGEEHERIGAIQDIQDDPTIDSELQTMGIGMPLNGGRHHRPHSHHHAHLGVGIPYMESHEVSRYHPSVDEFVSTHGSHHIPPDMTHHNEMTADEYHNHINGLMLKYHQLEEDMKGQHGNLMDRIDENMLHHHGHPPSHTGYDLYAYKNPWDNARLPYHVPVENHPDNSPIVAASPVGVPIEAKLPPTEAKLEPNIEAKEEPKVEAKSEEKPEEKPEEPKKEAKEEPKEGPKEEPKKDSDKPSLGDAPKPIQRGGPEKSGSIGLTSNNTLISEAIQKNIKEGDPASLKQAIFAYKSLNMTVPANLEIEELKEELKEAQEKAKAAEAASVKPQPTTIETHVPSAVPLVTQANLLSAQPLAIPSLPSTNIHEVASVKGKEPEKIPNVNAAKPVTPAGSVSDVNKILQDIKAKSPLTPPQNSQTPVNIPSIQQLNNIAQQAYLKEMLLNAASLAKQSQKNAEHEKEVALAQSAVKQATAQSHDKDALMQQAQILALLQGIQQKNKVDLPVASSLPNQLPNIVSLIPKTDSKPNISPLSHELNIPGLQNTGINNLLKQMALNKPHKQNMSAALSSPTPITAKSDDDNDDPPSLDIPDDDASSNSKSDSKQDAGDLVSILNSAGLLKKHKHQKKKKTTHKAAENAYARIGYEQAASGNDGYKVGSKKDIDDSSVETTTGVENASDTTNPKFDPIENSNENEDEEETSKKNKIKSKGNKKV